MCEEVRRRFECESLPPGGADQQLERFADRDVVVHDKHRRRCVRRSHDVHPTLGADNIVTSSKRGRERIEQGRVAERLEQTGYRPSRDETWLQRSVALRRDEDRRNAVPLAQQFPVEIWAIQSGQSDVQDQAAGLADRVRFEEGLSRRKGLSVEAEMPQQVRQRLADRYIVVDDGHEPAVDLHCSIAPFGTSVYQTLVLGCTRACSGERGRVERIIQRGRRPDCRTSCDSLCWRGWVRYTRSIGSPSAVPSTEHRGQAGPAGVPVGEGGN